MGDIWYQQSNSPPPLPSFQSAFYNSNSNDSGVYGVKLDNDVTRWYDVTKENLQTTRSEPDSDFEYDIHSDCSSNCK